MKKSFLYFICCVSAMGGLLFGYDWVVIGGAKPFYELYFDIQASPMLQGLAMSIALVGCLIGAMVAGALADRFGRKPLLIIAAMLFLTSAVGTGLFSDFVWFNVARLWGGIGIGVASALSPMYIAEVSPKEIRGKLVSINQMAIVLGILGAQICNFLLAEESVQVHIDSWNAQMGWRWMFWAEAVPAGMFLALAFFIPESPVYLRLKSENISEHSDEVGLKELFGNVRYRGILILGIVIAVFQQWCGTNVNFNYAEEIFKGAGYDVNGMFINIVVTGIANVIFTIVAMATVERLGRRTLMLIGSLGLGIIYLILGTCYFAECTGIGMVCLVVAAISCYAMTLGPITWVLLAEIFPNRVRGIAMATCTFALWVGSCTLTFCFPPMNAALGTYGSFWIYSAICFAGFTFFWKRCPETKGTALSE
ncbi:MAG: sugar porter family MFS transporter [Marinilabiliaceae bacterium]|nr:sugar porter family MFS transporter [Marinilabiliaceae bacterium]